MQSRLIQPTSSFCRKPLACLTFCAIFTANSPAIAQTSPPETPSATSAISGIDMPFAAGKRLAFTLGSTKAPFAGALLPSHPLGAVATQAEQQPPAPAPASSDEGSGLRTAGYVAGGVGIVGLVLFAIAGLAAKSAYDKLDADCGNTPCTDPEHRSDIEGGRLMQTAANIGLAMGLTGLGVGATLLVLGNRPSNESRGPSASGSGNGGMITYGGHF